MRKSRGDFLVPPIACRPTENVRQVGARPRQSWLRCDTVNNRTSFRPFARFNFYFSPSSSIGRSCHSLLLVYIDSRRDSAACVKRVFCNRTRCTSHSSYVRHQLGKAKGETTPNDWITWRNHLDSRRYLVKQEPSPPPTSPRKLQV